MRVFLDFEASSLGKNSYPIEVAWVFEDGRSESHLIRPAPGWTDWNEEAEALHGISWALLERDGTPHERVARRVLEALAEHVVYASAPSWDGKWLSVLLRAAGLPRHAMRLKDTDEAHHETAAEVLRDHVAEHDLAATITEVIARAQEAGGRQEAAHRALQDAEREWRIWLNLRRLAREKARSGQETGRSGAAAPKERLPTQS